MSFVDKYSDFLNKKSFVKSTCPEFGKSGVVNYGPIATHVAKLVFQVRQGRSGHLQKFPLIRA